MDKVAPALRRQGAALLVDATHGVGVMPIDVGALDPDFLVFPTYKWVLGPYGRAFLYVAKRHQGGVPLEQTAFGRKSIAAEQVPYIKDMTYVEGARRYDMGERDHFISLEMAAAPASSQAFMLVGAAVLVPLILAYTAWSYWVFRGKVAHEGYH